MGHLTLAKGQVYQALAKRLDKNPVGARLNDTLMEILYCMYTETEAKIGSEFPLGFTTLDRLAVITGLDEQKLSVYLDNMADKGLVIDVPRNGKTYFMLTPPVIGFFEYTFMRVTDKVPMQQLAELFEQYHHEPGVAEEFFGAETKMFRTLLYESLIPEDVTTEVLTYQKAEDIIREAGSGALTMCYCRHQTKHLGKNCDAPIEDVCTSLGNAAEWLIRRGFARSASVDEMLQVLEKTEKLGLAHLGDNVQNNPAYICHCCGCCCGVLRAINEHQTPSVHPSPFIPREISENCTGCGACVKRCHIKAISLMGEAQGNQKKAVINKERCIGCGACLAGCKNNAIEIVGRENVYVPPKNKKEQMARIAREKGK